MPLAAPLYNYEYTFITLFLLSIFCAQQRIYPLTPQILIKYFSPLSSLMNLVEAVINNEAFLISQTIRKMIK